MVGIIQNCIICFFENMPFEKEKIILINEMVKNVYNKFSEKKIDYNLIYEWENCTGRIANKCIIYGCSNYIELLGARLFVKGHSTSYCYVAPICILHYINNTGNYLKTKSNVAFMKIKFFSRFSDILSGLIFIFILYLFFIAYKI